jgi:hypothetical protein
MAYSYIRVGHIILKQIYIYIYIISKVYYIKNINLAQIGKMQEKKGNKVNNKYRHYRVGYGCRRISHSLPSSQLKRIRHN